MAGGFEIGLWVLLVVAALTDLIWGKIFNKVTFLFIITGVIGRTLLSGLSGGLEAITAVTVAFAIFFPLYWIKALAAGDVKLLMAVGAWSNYRLVLRLAVISILVGAVVGVIFLIRKRGLGGAAQSVGAMKRTRMPYAPAFLCAYFLVKIGEMYRWSLI